MANAAADTALQDQLTEAFSVNTTKVEIVVTDERINFRSVQVDGVTPSDLVHTIRFQTKSESLISALVAALVATGRP